MGSWTADKFRSCSEELDFDALTGLYAGDAVLELTLGWDEATRERWRREAPMVRR